MAPLPEIPAIPPILVAQAGSARKPARPGVRGPAAPAPPTVKTPTIAAAALETWPVRARRLTTALLDPAQLDNVRVEIANLSKDDRAFLDQALLSFPVSQPKLVEQAYLLRRIIRIARNPPIQAVPKAMVGPTGGTDVPGMVKGKRMTSVPVFRGKVTFKTGVTDLKGRSKPASSGYSLAYTGGAGSTNNLRWLQFIWRMILVDYADPRPTLTGAMVQRRTLNQAQQPFLFTMDATRPRWTVDTGSARTPFFEEAVNRSATELVMFDAPTSEVASSGLAKRLFTSRLTPAGEPIAAAPHMIIERFRAVTYLVNGMDVLYRAGIHLVWRFTGTSEPAPSLDATDKPSWSLTGKLDPAHRAALHRQFPLVDYLPGDRLEPPDPLDAFEPIPALDPAEWAKATTNLDRLVEVARLARADLIPAVTGMGPTSIKDYDHDVLPATGTPTQANVGLRPGLNLSKNMSAEGQTGVVVSDRTGTLKPDETIYHNPDLPTERDGDLPQIAIKMGHVAFQKGVVRPESSPVATMRHEMLHAAHVHLAIGWLLVWRDELTTDAFGLWLDKRALGGRPTIVERAYVSTGIPDPAKGGSFDLTATEILAFTEGVATSIPFLPVSIDFDRDLLEEGRWPGAVMSMRGAAEKYRSRSSSIEPAVKDRLRAAICVLTASQRAALRLWLDLLRDPAASSSVPNPPTSAQAPGVGLLGRSFPRDADFVMAVREVEAACPPP